PVIFFFGGGLIVKTDFPNADYAFFVDKQREDFHHLLRKRFVIRLTGIQSNCAIMLDPELRGTETLPPDKTVVVISERSNACPRLTQPECRLNKGYYSHVSHCLIVIRCPRRHVDVRIKEGHTLDCIAEIRNRNSRLNVFFGEMMTTTHIVQKLFYRHQACNRRPGDLAILYTTFYRRKLFQQCLCRREITFLTHKSCRVLLSGVSRVKQPLNDLQQTVIEIR